MSKILPICFFCNVVPSKGIAGGFWFKGFFICEHCEKELINCKINQLKYRLALQKIRKILFRKNPGQYLPGLEK